MARAVSLDAEALDVETDSERDARHAEELLALRARGLLHPSHDAYWSLTERQRVEWYEHPTRETLARRAAERAVFVADKTSEGQDEDKSDRPRRMNAKRAPRANTPAPVGVAPKPTRDKRGGRWKKSG